MPLPFLTSKSLEHYSEADTLQKAIIDTLKLDIRSVHQGRGQAVDAAAGQQYVCRFDALCIEFTTFSSHVSVDRISVGKASGRPSPHLLKLANDMMTSSD